MRRGPAVFAVLAASFAVLGCLSFYRVVTPDRDSRGLESALAPSEVLEQGEGELIAPDQRTELGLIRQPVEHAFTYRNRGRVPVTITGVHPSCNCTVTKPDKTLLQPGETGRIVVTVEPQRQQAGRHTHVIALDYRGQTVQRLRFELSFQNWPDVALPEQLDLRVVTGQAGTIQFDLVDYRDRPLRVTKVATSSPDLTARVVSEPTSFRPGWSYQFEVAVTPGTTLGERSEAVYVHTDDPQRSIVPIHLHIHRRHRVRVAPAAVHLTRTEAGRQEARLFISDSQGGSVEINSVTPSDKTLSYEVQPSRSSGGQEVLLRLDGRLTGPPVPLTVRLVISRPVREEYVVEVHPCDP